MNDTQQYMPIPKKNRWKINPIKIQEKRDIKYPKWLGENLKKR